MLRQTLLSMPVTLLDSIYPGRNSTQDLNRIQAGSHRILTQDPNKDLTQNPMASWLLGTPDPLGSKYYHLL